MIDISDGLATDAEHIGQSSGVSLQVELERLPLAEGVSSAEQAAGAGEDYELCVCVPPELRVSAQDAVSEVSDAGLTWIGQVGAPGPAEGAQAPDERAQAPGVRLSDERGEIVRLQGFEHRW